MSLRAAALVGFGVLALLVAIGVFGRGGEPPAGDGPAALASPSVSPSAVATPPAAPEPVPSPTASPSAAATSRPAGTRTATRSPKPAATVSDARLTADPGYYHDACTRSGLDVTLTVTITLSRPGAQVRYSIPGVGAFTATASGTTYTATHVQHIDNSRKNMFRFALDVTAPSAANSTATMVDNCH